MGHKDSKINIQESKLQWGNYFFDFIFEMSDDKGEYYSKIKLLPVKRKVNGISRHFKSEVILQIFTESEILQLNDSMKITINNFIFEGGKYNYYSSVSSEFSFLNFWRNSEFLFGIKQKELKMNINFINKNIIPYVEKSIKLNVINSIF